MLTEIAYNILLTVLITMTWQDSHQEKTPRVVTREIELHSTLGFLETLILKLEQ